MKRSGPASSDAPRALRLGGRFAALDHAMVQSEILSRLDAWTLGQLARTCRAMRALARPRLRVCQQRLVHMDLLRMQRDVVLHMVLPHIRAFLRCPLPTALIDVDFEIVMRESVSGEVDGAWSAAAAMRGSASCHTLDYTRDCDRAWTERGWTLTPSQARLTLGTLHSCCWLPWPGSEAPWQMLTWACRRDLFTSLPDPVSMLLGLSAVGAGAAPDARDSAGHFLTPLMHAVPVDGPRPYVAFVCTLRPTSQRGVAALGSLQQLTLVVWQYDLTSGHTTYFEFDSSTVAHYVQHTLAGSFPAVHLEGAFLRLPPTVAQHHQTTHALRPPNVLYRRRSCIPRV